MDCCRNENLKYVEAVLGQRQWKIFIENWKMLLQVGQMLMHITYWQLICKSFAVSNLEERKWI